MMGGRDIICISVMTDVTIFLIISSVCDKQVLIMSTGCTYREQKSVFKVGEVSVALFTAVHPILLVYDLLVAVCRWTGLVQTILTSVQQCSHTAKIVRLGGENKMRGKEIKLQG